MAARTSAIPMADERDLVIMRVFDAPRSLVFEAWTQPEHLARWWGPQGFVNVAWEIDVRPGGAWFRRMQAPDGTLFTKRGVYREVVPPERLVFTYVNEAADGTPGRETLVTVTFEEQGARTRLTLLHTGFESAESRDAHQGGWTSCMGRFADYLAAA
jgi:uncharacterized protein YndB with AHSA1/START domain